MIGNGYKVEIGISDELPDCCKAYAAGAVYSNTNWLNKGFILAGSGCFLIGRQFFDG